MPRIQEYLPEVEAQGPVGGLSPNIEQDTMYGRGVEKFASEVGAGVEYLHRRQEQSETSEAYATAAQARVEFNSDLQDKINNGTLDIDKLKEKYTDWVSKQSESYSTPAGRNFFNRQAARLGGQLLRTAGKGQALIAGRNAVADLQNAVGSNTNVLENDPSQFGDIYDSSLEYLHQKASEGTIHAADIPKYEKEIGLELSKATIRGYAKVDPELAKQHLEHGSFDEYMNSDQKRGMYAEVHQFQTAKDIEAERAQKLMKAAQNEAFEKWGNDNLPKLVKNSLSTKEILASPGTWEQKERWLTMARSAQKENSQTDPAFLNGLYKRMFLPDNDPKKITDPAQLQQYVGKGISPHDYAAATSWFDKTPQGQAMNTNRKQLMEIASTRLTKDISGKKDDFGEYNLSQFTQALQSAEGEMRQKGEPVSSLYDVHSKNYFGNQINRFYVSPEKRMQQQAERIRNEFRKDKENIAPPAPSNVYNPPGIGSDNQDKGKEEMVDVVLSNGQKGKMPKSKVEKARKDKVIK